MWQVLLTDLNSAWGVHKMLGHFFEFQSVERKKKNDLKIDKNV